MTIDAILDRGTPLPLAPPLPRPRGALTAALVAHLALPPHDVGPTPVPTGDALDHDDLQLALYCCYELHYRSFDGVHDGWEWEPSLLAFRRTLEDAFVARLTDELGPPREVADVVEELATVMAGSRGPSLSSWMLDHGTLDHLREFAVHRSAYQLKEADPHTWAIPRLAGGVKAALVTIQLDEYGGGDQRAMHASLFADTMAALGLDNGYGAYLDVLPGATLATTNLVSMFGLHRRWRGALAGHLAVFESTSVGPMTRYAKAFDRLGVDKQARRFYDVHVEADVVHEVVACSALAGGLAAAEPALAGDIVFGAEALMLVEGGFSRRLLEAWCAGRSSLPEPWPSPPAPGPQRAPTG